MSGINPPDSRISLASLDRALGQVAFDQPQQGPDGLRDAGIEGLHTPLDSTPAEIRDAGEEFLLAKGWDDEGPRHFDAESATQTTFGALSLTDAASQAPDFVAAALLEPQSQVDAAA